MDSNVLFKDNVDKIKQYLKVHPEDINILSYGKTLLMKAVIEERVDIIDCLIEHSCDVNFQGNCRFTALHYACFRRNINRDIIERLIANGASGLHKTSFCDTPLHFAAQNAKDVNIIHQLLFVSDPNSLDGEGKNPLMSSYWNKNIEIISALINVTHDINLQDIDGCTVLHYCCIQNNYEAIHLLLSSGADLFIKDNEGKTPYDLVDEEGKRIINEYLASRN